MKTIWLKALLETSERTYKGKKADSWSQEELPADTVEAEVTADSRLVREKLPQL